MLLTEIGEKLGLDFLIDFTGNTISPVWKGLKNLPCNFGQRADLAWLERRSGLAEHQKTLFSVKFLSKYCYLVSKTCTERIYIASSENDQMFKKFFIQ